MRKDETARRSGIFEDLFAERQVYLRSGLTSRYVVLSRPLQIGVTIAMGLIIAWLAYASYSAIAKQFELAGQSRELARLEGVNKSLQVAAGDAQSAEELRSQAARVPELSSALSAAQAARERAENLTKTASAQADQLRQELALAQARIDKLTAAGQPSGQAADADGATAADAGGQLAKAQAQIEELSQALDQARADGDKLSRQLADARGGAEQQVAALTERATTSEAEVERLRGDLDAALKDAAGLRQAAQTAETDLADLRTEVANLRAQAPAGAAAQDLAEVKQPASDEVAKLRATLASAETRIAELTADLEAAKRAPAAGEAAGGPAPGEPTQGGPTQGGPTRGEPAAGTDGQTVANLQEQLDTANQRLGELQAALRSTVANLAPLPPPPAPR
jgi:DNA repair exonuclease SbcCD ATPase subunit